MTKKTYNASELKVGNLYVGISNETVFVFEEPFLLLSSTVHTEQDRPRNLIHKFQKVTILKKDRILTWFINLSMDYKFQKLNDE